MITAESAEDMYAVAGLIDDGDVVTASTMRKVQRDSGGASVSTRLLMRLGVEVTGTHLDAGAGVLRVNGRVTTEVEHVKLGSHHALELEPHRPFDVAKQSGWTQHHYDMLKEAVAAGSAADVIALMLEEGAAYVCAVSGPVTSVRAKVVHSVPKKRAGTSAHERGLEKFFEAVLDALRRHADWAAPAPGTAAASATAGGAALTTGGASSAGRPIIIASPGFLKDDFLSWALATAGSKGYKEVTEAANKGRFVPAHASAGNPRALRGVLSDPSVAARLAGTRAASDGAALEAFLRALHADPLTAVYGYRHVRAAAERGAVAKLLVVDSLLRAKDPAVRGVYSSLVDEVNRGATGAAGSAVGVLAGGHPAGAALAQMGGLAALLRYPVHDLDEAAAALPKAPVPGGAEGGEGGGDHDGSGGGAGFDSDASSDSDASFKIAARRRQPAPSAAAPVVGTGKR